MGSTMPPAPQLKAQRSEDFAAVYANNANFEASAWDLKVIFGQLDQAAGVVDQHTAVTLPWSLVKLALYQLQAQVNLYEEIYGKIKITADILPPAPPPLTDEQKQNPVFLKVHEMFKSNYEKMKKELGFT
ncbi:MAG TPA: DUF3467 domain-containing protein [Candidatus Acidoferrales bacterium]|jgi:hypothetical protein|nr:DUF3467 domain-containing protein [Candidatus Acidoferrales bacterium]